MIARPAPSGQTLLFGTRGSALAIAQTELAMARFRNAFPDQRVASRVIATEGDLDKQSPLTLIGGRGVFTNALEAAVIAGDVDAAVHSAKDLPTALHADAPIVALFDREDPRDVLVSRHGVALGRLPGNPLIGTSSRRRAVQIARLRPDACIVDLRGNIDTRLRKAAGGELDAIAIAAAGLLRMGWQDRITQMFALDEVIPSPGQGALAVQARAGSDVALMLERLDEPAVSVAVGIERAFLGVLGVGCALPVGAHATATGEGFRLIAMLADGSGERIVYADELLATGDERPHAAEIALRMRAETERVVQRNVWGGTPGVIRDLAGARVVVTRPRRQAGPLVDALRQRGAEVLLLPTIRVEPTQNAAALDAALRDAMQGAFAWLVFTSANAVDACACRMQALGTHPGALAGVGVAAVGDATAVAAEGAGFSVRLVPETPTAAGLAAAMRRVVTPPSRVVYPRSAIGGDALPDALRAAGIDVVAIEAYRTLPEQAVDQEALAQVQRGACDLITFASSSAASSFVKLIGVGASAALRIPAVCAGPATAATATEAGFVTVVAADGPGVEEMAEAVSRAWGVQSRLKDSAGGLGSIAAAAGARA